ncbi:TetR/AcrR family transcriptional regulator [Arthrobacter sp. RAF14]|uniref:TetR/AcrR family transcriptional regulator n=1 Tax=Arthrobacter sp. RAF14 TaxID=3233051 RepID=UPI003F912E79
MGYTPREERKARLAEAVWEIVLEHGISAVSVRSVAARAGMAVGSLRHLFPTQSELIEFSAELMVERATERVSAVVPGPDPVGYVVAVISELLPLTPATRREFELNMALIAETPGNPGLARARDDAHARLLDLFIRLAGFLRDEDPAEAGPRHDGRRLLALCDGLGLHLLHQSADADTGWAIDLIREELGGIRVASEG